MAYHPVDRSDAEEPLRAFAMIRDAFAKNSERFAASSRQILGDSRQVRGEFADGYTQVRERVRESSR